MGSFALRGWDRVSSFFSLTSVGEKVKHLMKCGKERAGKLRASAGRSAMFFSRYCKSESQKSAGTRAAGKSLVKGGVCRAEKPGVLNRGKQVRLQSPFSCSRPSSTWQKWPGPFHSKRSIFSLPRFCIRIRFRWIGISKIEIGKVFLTPISNWTYLHLLIYTSPVKQNDP